MDHVSTIFRNSFNGEKIDIFECERDVFSKDIASIVQKISSPAIKISFTESEYRCLQLILSKANDFLEIEKSLYLMEYQLKKAGDILLGKGTRKEKIDEALKCVNLSKEQIKRDRKKELKSSWESLLTAQAVHANGKWQISIIYSNRGSRPVTLEWDDHPKKRVLERNKKMAIISLLREQFEYISDNAVIVALREAGATRPPAFQNSGTRHSSPY